MPATSASHMLRVWLFLALALSRLAIAQYTAFSECLKLCVTSSVTADCKGDPECICVSIFFTDITECTCRVCDANDVSMLKSTSNSICSGIPNGGDFTCPANSLGTKNATSSVTTITTTTFSSTSLATEVITPSTSSSTAGTSATPGAAGNDGTASDSGLSTGAKAGIGAGAGGGLLLVIGLIIFFTLRRRVQVTWRSPGNPQDEKGRSSDESLQFLQPITGKGTDTKKTMTPSDHTVTELSSPTTPQTQYAEVATKQGNSYELSNTGNTGPQGGYNNNNNTRPYAEAPVPTGSFGNNHELPGQQGQVGLRYAEAYTSGTHGTSHELGHQGQLGPRYTEAYTTHGNSHELNGLTAYSRAPSTPDRPNQFRAELSSANYSR